MSRVNLDAAAGWLQGESTLLPSPRAQDDAADAGSFGRHLQEAHRAAKASDDAAREPSSGDAAAGRSKTSAEDRLQNSPRDRSPESAGDENAGEDPKKTAEPSRELPSSEKGTADSSGPAAGNMAEETADDDTDPDDEPLANLNAALVAAAALVPEPVEDVPPPGGGVSADTPAGESVKASAALPAAAGLAYTMSDAQEEAPGPASQAAEPAAASQAAVEVAAGAEAISPEEIGGDAAGEEAPAESGQGVESSAVSSELGGKPDASGDLTPGRSTAGGDPDREAEGRVAESSGEAALADPAATEEDATAPPSSPGEDRNSGVRRNSRIYGEGQPAANEAQGFVPGGPAPPEATARPAGVQSAEGARATAGGESKDAAVPSTSSASSDGKPADPAAVQVANTPAAEDVAGQSADSSQGDAAERARFVQRVARALESAADRAGQVRLRLYPPELGSVRLDLTVRNGHMTARMETETQSAQSMLLDNLPSLKERLAEHGITVERFEVAWQGQTQGGLSQGANDPSRWQTPSSGYASAPSGKADESPGTDGATQTSRRFSPGTSFDVVI